MDINFPLILVCAVAVTGLIILVDQLFLRSKRKPEVKVPAWVEFSVSFFPVLLLVLVLRSFLVEPFKIPSSSMVPTLEVGDFILVNKYTYGIRLPVTNTKIFNINTPKRGDVMVFFPPDDKRYFIKRVIGMPGDEIRYINGVLYINGEEMKQELIVGDPVEQPAYFIMSENLGKSGTHVMRKRIIPTPISVQYESVVPEGQYFMMGDNRDNSSDSRIWGPVPEDHIVGKAFAVWMHWDSFLSLPKFDRIRKII